MRGEAEPGAPPAQAMLGIELAGDDQSGGWPYFVRQDVPVEPGDCPLHIATGIQRVADARLIAAAPDLAAALLALLVAPAITATASTRAHARRSMQRGRFWFRSLPT